LRKAHAIINRHAPFNDELMPALKQSGVDIIAGHDRLSCKKKVVLNTLTMLLAAITDCAGDRSHLFRYGQCKAPHFT
jgi:polyphosphate kinase